MALVAPVCITPPVCGAISFVFKSTDGGTSWAELALGGSGTGSIFALAVDPTMSATVYATTALGVSKSTDGGATWMDMGTGLTGGGLALAIHASSPATCTSARTRVVRSRAPTVRPVGARSMPAW